MWVTECENIAALKTLNVLHIRIDNGVRAFINNRFNSFFLAVRRLDSQKGSEEGGSIHKIVPDMAITYSSRVWIYSRRWSDYFRNSCGPAGTSNEHDVQNKWN